MRLSEKINGSVSSLFESSYNQALNESESYTFQEIIDMMENAEDYAELKNAASYIKNEKLRKDVEEEIQQCYMDNDSVETAYSIVTSDLLDMRIYDDNVEVLEETTDRQIENKKQDLYSRERQALKDLGDDNWEDLIGLKDRLPKEQFDAFMDEEGEIRTIEMIHSILTYAPKENWNVDYVMENKYLKKYIEQLGEDKVKELVQQEVDEYINNATVEQGTYTDSEGVTYNSVTFKNESEKLTESDEDIKELLQSKIIDGKLPDEIEYKGKTYKQFGVMDSENSGETSQVYYCNMKNTPSGDPQESNDYFFAVVALDKTDDGFKGVKEIRWVEDLTEDYWKDREEGKCFGCKEVVNDEDAYIIDGQRYCPVCADKIKNNESEKLTEGTKQKRIARFGEFDNGHVLHSWYEMTDEEAEEKAKQASIDDPTDVYYVSNDDIMNPNSGIYWYKGKSYSNEEVNEIRKKEKENIEIKESENNDIEVLAQQIYDWYDNDMGIHFDEIKGNEEEVLNGIIAVLENKDMECINSFINDIENANLDEDKDLLEKLKSIK